MINGLMKSKPSKYLEESNFSEKKIKESAVCKQIIASNKFRAKLWAEDRAAQHQNKATENRSAQLWVYKIKLHTILIVIGKLAGAAVTRTSIQERTDLARRANTAPTSDDHCLDNPPRQPLDCAPIDTNY